FAADEGCFDRQLAMPPVDEGEELYPARPAVVEQRIQRGTDGAPGIEHIIDQNDVARIDVEADVALLHHRAYVARRKIVAVKADVQHAGINRMLLDVRNHLREALRQGHAASL